MGTSELSPRKSQPDERYDMDQKRALSFPLRLSSSVRQRAAEIAQQDQISLNHFISLAVAEKISRLEHESWLREQSRRTQAHLLSHPISSRYSRQDISRRDLSGPELGRAG